MFERALKKTRSLRRFGRARRGSAAVEFAMVILPFFMLTFGLAEVAMLGFAQTSLDFAVSETARQIRTGRAQSWVGALGRNDQSPRGPWNFDRVRRGDDNLTALVRVRRRQRSDTA